MWDPGQYLEYADLRSRPFVDLLARVDIDRPRRVIDLGCGPGHLTGLLARRWPGSEVEAVDSSPEMVASAHAAGVAARVADVTEWRPRPDTDVVVCNAVLHWVSTHEELLSRWVRQLPSGARLAVQVPGNFDAPSHRAVCELAAEPVWANRLRRVSLHSEQTVHSPVEYAELLAAEGCSVDAWETTYVQRLTGENPVLEWISGTALRPVKAALDVADWHRFRDELARRLVQAYPPRDDGSTWFPFRRVFFVAGVP